MYLTKNFLRPFCLLSSLFCLSVYGQEVSDTLLVRTRSTPFWTERYYVIGGAKEMVVIEKEEKNDTTFYDEIEDDVMAYYKEELETRRIRKLPIEKIDADMVFKYFDIGDSIVDVTRRLGNKKIHVYPAGFKVTFYNKFRKKNEVFDFYFREGKLVRLGRPSTNTLPTNDVWTAFQLLKLKDSLNDLESAIDKLKKKRR